MSESRPTTFSQVVSHLIAAGICFALGALSQYDHVSPAAVAAELCTSHGLVLGQYVPATRGASSALVVCGDPNQRRVSQLDGRAVWTSSTAMRTFEVSKTYTSVVNDE